MIRTINQSPIQNQLWIFLKEYGDELEVCSFPAFLIIKEIVREEDPSLQKEKLQDFIWYFADELDICNPEAFDIIYRLAKIYDLEIW